MTLQPGVIKTKRAIQEEKTAKKSLLDKIKGISPRNLFNKSVETLLNNEPLILGGLLGGLGAIALHDPKTAALLGAVSRPNSSGCRVCPSCSA